MTIRDLPRLARAALGFVLPTDWRDDILRDLEEAWTKQRASHGWLRARVWLALQCLAFAVRFLPDRVREVVGEPVVGSTDLKLAVRSLVRAPLVGLLALVSLAVGIGAAVGGYTFIEGGFFTDLPFEGGDRIVMVEDYDHASRSSIGIGADEFLRRRAELESFEHLEAYQQRSVVLGAEGDEAEVVTALYTTPGFLRMTEVRPVRGRLPGPADAISGADPVAVLPHSLWVTATGMDPDVVGSRLEIGGVARTVIGVMPEGFGFPYADDLWLPFDVGDAEGSVRVVGKLREGVDLGAARAEMSVVAIPDPARMGPSARIEHLVTGVTRPLANESEVFVLAIPIAILVLLLIVMATNVANLILARNAARARELAVRSALGASRGRIVGQLVAEVALISLGATALGVWLSQRGIALVDARLRFPFWVDFSVDPGTVGFAVGLGALVTLVAGIAPALRATSGSADDALRGAGTGASAVRFGRLTGALIVMQLTVCVGFLSSATLFGQSLLSYGWDRYGLPADETLVAQIYLPLPEEITDPESIPGRAERASARSDFLAETRRKLELLGEEIEALPGIRMSAFASRFPGNESDRDQVEVEGSDEAVQRVEVAEIGPGYFELMDAGLLRGRGFSPEEHAEETSRVVLVNEPFVLDRLGGADPLGRRIRIAASDSPPRSADRAGSTSAGVGGTSDAAPWRTIVGVVPDLGLNPGNPDNAAGVYLPLGPTNVVRFAVRGDGDPGSWASRLVETARQVDEELQVQWSRTLADQMAEPVMIFKGLGLAFLVLGALALLLSAASIHALTGCTVTRRTRELGIRQALGADAGSIVRTVLARAGTQLAVGTLLGTALAAGVLRMSTAMPWEIRQANPVALLLVAAVLVLSGATALATPLRRALSIRPADAMRVE